MKEKTKLLLVDDNESVLELMEEYFSENKKYEVKDLARNGEEALELILENKDDYDVILLDLVMPKKDGLYVLEELKQRKIRKNIIVITSYNEAETIRQVSEYGVRFFVLKPFELEQVDKKITEIMAFNERNSKIINLFDNNMQVTVTKILHELGIPSHVKGYSYIREAILMVFNDPSLIGGITKELYPEISIMFKTSVSRVERAIRHAIEISWNRGDWELMEEIFGHSVDIDKAKPTNSEFIVTIADKLRLEMLKVN